MSRKGGCLPQLLLLLGMGVALGWVLVVALNPWALHIGGRSTPLLYWHGAGLVQSKGNRTLPLYVSFWPGRPAGFHGGGRRQGKLVSARLQGTGWLCISPGNIERMSVSGTMYGGYTSDVNSLLEFRLLEWKQPFSIDPPKRGFFDLAGGWRGPELVLNSPGQQGIRFKSGLFVDHAIVTLRWQDYETFEAECGRAGQ